MLAHISLNGEEETVEEHCIKTAELAERIAGEVGLQKTAYLSAYLHDMGKMTDMFTRYLITVTSEDGKWNQEKLNHSSAGGKYLIEKYPATSVPEKITEQIIAWSIFSHHGINDLLTVEKENQFYKRLHPEREIYYEEVLENFQKSNPCDISKLLQGSLMEIKHKFVQIRESSNREDVIFFLLGMLARLNLSILIDSDRTSTAVFCNGVLPREKWNTQELWDELERKLNLVIAKFPCETQLAKLRGHISDECYRAGDREPGIYTLQVPTGGGKTLASMRFALNHAKQHKKTRIFYIAPFKSILEQNALVYRKIFGNEVILEYHSDIIVEDEGEDYRTLTENFDSPIVLTTMVQFLNTFFSGQTQCVRRMHAFANAVIILDEVQSIPIHMIHLFNCAMNFLKVCCGSTIVLCSATQPRLAKTEKPIALTGEIISDVTEVGKGFKRNTVIDKTKIHTCQEIADFAVQQLEGDGSGIVIANTKRVAMQIYTMICQLVSPDTAVFHLSTNMCPQHRNDIFEQFKQLLLGDKKAICISTQLIEAGVDISAGFVIRTLAGWDSIMQAAGRCNRNAESANGNVFVVKCDEENLSRLRSIREGRDVAVRVLDEFEKCPELYGDDLLSPMTSDMYYKYYFNNNMEKMDYFIQEDGTTIFELLSIYGRAEGEKEGLVLTQPFKEAGKKFQAIDADTRGVIVPYGEGKHIIEQLNSRIYDSEIPHLLKSAQRFTINLYESKLHQLEKEGVISKLYSCDAYYLEEQYFDDQVGIKENGILEDLIF